MFLLRTASKITHLPPEREVAVDVVAPGSGENAEYARR
jgi:hypothetical protein